MSHTKIQEVSKPPLYARTTFLLASTDAAVDDIFLENDSFCTFILFNLFSVALKLYD